MLLDKAKWDETSQKVSLPRHAMTSEHPSQLAAATKNKKRKLVARKNNTKEIPLPSSLSSLNKLQRSQNIAMRLRGAAHTVMVLWLVLKVFYSVFFHSKCNVISNGFELK